MKLKSCLLFTFISFQLSYAQNNTFQLSGDLKNLKEGTKIVLSISYPYEVTHQPIDSTYAKNNTFQFKGELDKFNAYNLSFFDIETKKFLTAKRIYLDGPTIRLKGNFNKIKKVSIEGSDLSIVNNGIVEILDRYRKKRIIKNGASEPEPQPEMKKSMLNYLFNNPNNFVSLNRFLYQFQNISKDSLALFYTRLDANLRNTEKGQFLKLKSDHSGLDIGDRFDYFESKNTDGKTISLSSFKNKVILLDFWAYWCTPCRHQNKNQFPALLETFKNDEFEIVSYSVDIDKGKWISASTADKISWTNLSNLQGRNDFISLKYNIDNYPTSLIIDQNGIIRFKFIGIKEKETLAAIKTLLDE